MLLRLNIIYRFKDHASVNAMVSLRVIDENDNLIKAWKAKGDSAELLDSWVFDTLTCIRAMKRWRIIETRVTSFRKDSEMQKVRI